MTAVDTDARTWLHNPEIGGTFHCPDGAVEAWLQRGWQVMDTAPQEPDPAVVELVAWREAEAARLNAEQAAQAADTPAGTDEAPAPTKRRGAPTDTTKEA